MTKRGVKSRHHVLRFVLVAIGREIGHVAEQERFAVNSWIYANGENPAVVEVEKWYIKDINNLRKPPISRVIETRMSATGSEPT